MRAVATFLSARPLARRLAAFAGAVLLVVATRVAAGSSALAQPVDGTAGGGGAATSLSLGIAADFPGIAFNNLIPPNAVMAAGPQHVVAATNGGFAVFTKDGAV